MKLAIFLELFRARGIQKVLFRPLKLQEELCCATSHFRFLIFCLCIIAVSGCQFGEAHFESDPSSQKSFRPTGTVFAYIDAHDPQLQIRDNPRLHIIMSWLVFNPNDDLSTIQGSRLEDMRHEILLRDLMTMHFYPSTEATKGSQLESIVSHADILSDGRFVAHVLPASRDFG